MKSLLKLIGIIAMVAVIGFSMISCGSKCGKNDCYKDGECTTNCGDPFPNCDCPTS